VPCGSHYRKVAVKENKVPLDEKLKVCHPCKKAGRKIDSTNITKPVFRGFGIGFLAFHSISPKYGYLKILGFHF
jgi:hypothetical protein